MANGVMGRGPWDVGRRGPWAVRQEQEQEQGALALALVGNGSRDGHTPRALWVAWQHI